MIRSFSPPTWLAGIVVFTALVNDAHANCSQADLTGAWLASGAVNGTWNNIVATCFLVIGPSGQLASRSSCKYVDPKEFFTATVKAGGQLILTDGVKCEFSGTLTVASARPGAAPITAFLSRSKDVLVASGPVTKGYNRTAPDALGKGKIVQFSAVKK